MYFPFPCIFMVFSFKFLPNYLKFKQINLLNKMSNKLKMLLLDKFSQHAQKTVGPQHLRNVIVSYKHYEKSFIVNLKGNQNVEEVSGHHNQNTSSNLQDLLFSIDRETFIQTILSERKNNEQQPDISPKRVVIDFSSPNIAKPFHAGHLRSTIIGNFIANINKYYNNKVTRINYLGDWGTQFGLLQFGLQAKRIDIAALKNNAVNTLYETYVYANQLAAKDKTVLEQARKYFADIEQGRASLEGWKKIRLETVKEIENVYQRLGVQFDDYHWESDYNGGAIKELMTSLENQNIINTDDSGKKVVSLNEKPVIVLKSDNSTLYLSRDIAALLDRYKRYNFDKMLYVVDNSQTDHFRVLFDVMKRINEDCAKGCEHVKFGRIKGMSTRSGNVVFLNDILDEAKAIMYEKQQQSKNTRSSAINEETCDTLGITAVVINDLKQRRQREYTFSWDRALQNEGDSGIKLQYLHCRLWSLEKNSGVALPDCCDPSCIPEEIVGEVIAELSRFEDVLYRSSIEYEACIIVNYLFRLSKYVNRMFNELKVKNVSQDVASQRLLVFHSARLVVKTGLEILGVKPLYQM